MNYSDPAHVAAAERQAKRIERERRAVVKSVMLVRPGRELIHSILSELGVFQTPFRSDPHTTAFNCGIHNAGLMWFAMVMAAAPDEYILMMKENSDGRPTPPADGPDAEPDPDAAEPN